MADPLPTIASRVAELRAARTPTPATRTFETEQQVLQLVPPPEGVLAVESVMPDGDLLDPVGHPTSLLSVLHGAPGVVVFYRGAWCPYCNIALRTYREQLVGPLEEMGVVLVALSPQAADGSMSMKEKQDLPFAVLSDPGNQIAGALGILTQPSDTVRAAQLERGFDLETVNADGTTSLPMPTVALVNARGELVWIDVHPDHTTRTEPAQILQAVHDHLIHHGAAVDVSA